MNQPSGLPGAPGKAQAWRCPRDSTRASSANSQSAKARSYAGRNRPPLATGGRARARGERGGDTEGEYRGGRRNGSQAGRGGGKRPAPNRPPGPPQRPRQWPAGPSKSAGGPAAVGDDLGRGPQRTEQSNPADAGE